jgi:hypothetical protein
MKKQHGGDDEKRKNPNSELSTAMVFEKILATILPYFNKCLLHMQPDPL